MILVNSLRATHNATPVGSNPILHCIPHLPHFAPPLHYLPPFRTLSAPSPARAFLRTAIPTMRATAVLPFVLFTLAAAAPQPIYIPPVVFHHHDPAAPLPTLARGVDDVGPAITNATATAFHRARDILSHYSDTLRVFAVPTGLAVSFFGYFLLTPVLFLAAFISGGGACFIAVATILGEDTPAAVWISIASMLLGGSLLGFLALRALNFGMFAVGAALGVVLASSVKTTLIAQAYPKDPRLAFIIAAVSCGLILGLLAMCLQKQMLIFSTAYAGSCACMFGIGSFAGHFPTTEDLSNVEAGHANAWVLLYIALTFILGTIGMAFQFWLARGKPMPEHAPHDRRRRRRRPRQYQFDDLSDDDDWADDVYVERVPLPRRKREPSRVRESSSAERSTVYERPQKEQRSVSRTTESQNSFDSVRNAPTAFETPPSSESTPPPANAPNADVRLPIEKRQASPTVKVMVEPSVEKTLSLSRSERTKPRTELFDLSDNPETVDVRHVESAQGRLEHVPLESDGENLAKA